MSWRPFDHNFLDILWSACNDVSTYIAAAYKRYKPRHKIFYKPHRPSVPKAWLCRSWRGPAAVAVRLRFLSSNKKKVTKLYLDSTTCENKIGQHYKKHKQSCAQQQWGWDCVLSFFQKLTTSTILDTDSLKTANPLLWDWWGCNFLSKHTNASDHYIGPESFNRKQMSLI